MSLKSAVACVGKVFTPKFYADQLSCWISGARRDFIRGSAAPLFKAMLIVGLVGYTVEYTNVGSKFLVSWFVFSGMALSMRFYKISSTISVTMH
jgi:hypothetical protein